MSTRSTRQHVVDAKVFHLNRLPHTKQGRFRIVADRCHKFRVEASRSRRPLRAVVHSHVRMPSLTVASKLRRHRLDTAAQRWLLVARRSCGPRSRSQRRSGSPQDRATAATPCHRTHTRAGHAGHHRLRKREGRRRWSRRSRSPGSATAGAQTNDGQPGRSTPLPWSCRPLTSRLR